MSIRTLIAGDHNVLRRPLRALLKARAKWMIGGEAGSSLKVVTVLLNKKP